VVLGRADLLGRLCRDLDLAVAVGPVMWVALFILGAIVGLSIILSNGRTWGP